jgi:hypothetical protein
MDTVTDMNTDRDRDYDMDTKLAGVSEPSEQISVLVLGPC